MNTRTAMLIEFIKGRGMKEFMLRYNITAYKMAKMTGLGTSTTSRWSNGAKPTNGSLKIIADALEGRPVNSGQGDNYPILERVTSNDNSCTGCYFAPPDKHDPACQSPKKYGCGVGDDAIIWVIKKERG